MDYKLEAIILPVADVDRAKSFYEQAGFTLDVDHGDGVNFRVVQFTPPGSACSVMMGIGLSRRHTRQREGPAPGGRPTSRRRTPSCPDAASPSARSGT